MNTKIRTMVREDKSVVMDMMRVFYASDAVSTNGSDEILNFAFMAFCDEKKGIAFPSISYGFYPVFAELNHIPYKEIPLKEDFSIDVEDYCDIGMNIVIANPNAPTGLALTAEEIEKIVTSNTAELYDGAEVILN